jgi:DNA-binding transcriptional MocR family regulator
MESRATSAKVARESARHELVGALGPWVAGTGPVYRKLARAIGLAIDRGALPAGSRLPAERDLAVAVTVSRGTAVAAYDLLVAEGRVERHRGSGTFVAGDPDALPEGREGTALVHRLVDASAAAAAPDLIDLSLSVLPDAAALGSFRITADDLRALDPPTGYSPWGLPALREAIAAHVSAWGLPTGADEIVVTSGAQQAISVAAACWIRPGDAVVVDDPTYPGAIAAFQAAGARLVGVAVDGEGPDPDGLRAALASRPALAYLQPAVHSPTGITTSARRRRELAAVLDDAGVAVLEDRALADLSWGSIAPPLVRDLDRVPSIVVGSLGKRFWGGLRLGFLRAPAPLALRCARIKATHDLGTSAVSQVIAERLLRSATEADRLELVARLRADHDVLASALRRAAPEWTWPEPAGGLSIWLDLAGTDGELLTRAARANGVVIASPSPLSLTRRGATHVRLAFAGPGSTLREGVERLVGAHLAGHGAPTPSGPT